VVLLPNFPLHPYPLEHEEEGGGRKRPKREGEGEGEKPPPACPSSRPITDLYLRMVVARREGGPFGREGRREGRKDSDAIVCPLGSCAPPIPQKEGGGGEKDTLPVFSLIVWPFAVVREGGEKKKKEGVPVGKKKEGGKNRGRRPGTFILRAGAPGGNTAMRKKKISPKEKGREKKISSTTQHLLHY